MLRGLEDSSSATDPPVAQVPPLALRALKPADPPGWRLETSLRSLAQLRDTGLITAEDFEAKKAELLSGPLA